MDGKWKDRIVVAITGASGVIYGVKLCQALSEAGKEVHLILSRSGKSLISMELKLTEEDLERSVERLYSNDELTSPLSSGSHRFGSMAIVPCSMKTLSAIACGNSDNLISRTAEVSLKEGRKLVLVPRETPLNLVHIRNMETLKLSGAVILPAMPAFYHQPESISDMVSFVVGKVMDQLQVEHHLFNRWTGVSHIQDS